MKGAITNETDKIRKGNDYSYQRGRYHVSIYTYNADLKRRLEKFSKQHPTLCKLESNNDEGGETYVLEKSRVSIRLVPPYSEERRKAASENAKENGFGAKNRVEKA